MIFLLKLNKWLVGWPDELLTTILVLIGIIDILVGIYGKPITKAFLAAYALFP